MTPNDPARNHPSDSDPNERERVVELVTRCLIAIEEAGGDDTAQRTVLDRFCAEHPSDAATLRKRIRLLRGMGALEPTPDPAALYDDGAPPPPSAPERLGDFRLVRVLAQGGMGVVYLAIQESLGREVALKLIRPDHLYFPAARERFRREVESVARMQHPSIVPVFTVGDSRGIPWFAMELVRGCSASEALEALRHRPATELSGRDLEAAVVARSIERGAQPNADARAALFSGSWVDTCLRIARDMLLGLDHAHRRGVLHRDLKPSNLMLTPEGRVLLVDFGLALSTKPGERSTVTAGLVGSIPYMAPEQFDEKREIDERTDVYGAGVVIHELLTLRNPFLVDDDGPTATQRRILAGHSTPLREGNPLASRDLAVVIAKAMALDPAERYSSAAALLRDVENLLARRPVDARPIPAPVKLLRAVKRNPLTSLTGALALISAIALPSTLLIQEKRASQRVRDALNIAEVQRGRAERNLLVSLTTVGEMIDDVGTEKVLRTPELGPIRLALIEHALDLYRKFLEDNSDNRALARALADTRRNAARLLLVVGRHDEAIEDFEASRKQFETLFAESPNDPVLRDRLIEIGQDYMAALLRRQRVADAVAVGRRALSIAAGADSGGESSAQSDFQYRCSRVENNLALALSSLGDLDGAESVARSAMTRLEGLRANGNESPAILRALIETRTNLDYVSNRRGNTPSIASRTETTELAREYAHLDDADLSRKQLLSTCLVNAASAYPEGDLTAIDLLREAIDIQSRLVDRVSDPIQARFERAAARLSLRSFLAGRGELDEPRMLAIQVLDELESIGGTRAIPDYVLEGLSRTSLWWANSPNDDHDRWLSYTTRAQALVAHEVERNPENAITRGARDSTGAAVINVLATIGDFAGVKSRLDALSQSLLEPAKWHFVVARTYALVADHIGSDPALVDTAGIVRECREKALHFLQRAIAEAGVSRTQIDEEPKFEKLRGDAEFEAIRASAR